MNNSKSFAISNSKSFAISKSKSFAKSKSKSFAISNSNSFAISKSFAISNIKYFEISKSKSFAISNSKSFAISKSKSFAISNSKYFAQEQLLRLLSCRSNIMKTFLSNVYSQVQIIIFLLHSCLISKKPQVCFTFSVKNYATKSGSLNFEPIQNSTYNSKPTFMSPGQHVYVPIYKRPICSHLPKQLGRLRKPALPY